MTIIIIILTVITAASITALFLRGFKIENLTEKFSNQEIQTPTIQVWLVQTANYTDKMEAYQAGIRAASSGLGVYVLPEKEKWIWVAGVYLTEADADSALNSANLPENASTKSYQITGKKFQLAPDAAEECCQILTAVQTVFNLLLNLRTAINNTSEDTSQILFDLLTQFNQLKSSTETLQTLNITLQNQLINTMIYSANQNILSLQEIVNHDASKPFSLVRVNTALLNTIFSLDNF